MNKIELTPEQMEALARPLASMAGTILEYYKNPEHEKDFQEWYLAKYGTHAPLDV